MFRNVNCKLLVATTLALTLGGLDLPSSTSSQTSWLNIGSQVEARSSGGRSSGGSFSKGSSRSSSSSSKSKPSSSSSSSSSSSPSRSYRPHRSHRPHTEIEIEIENDNYTPPRSTTTASSAGSMLFLNIILLLIILLIIFAVVYSILKSLASTPKGDRQRDNNIVTLTKLQVALLAQATEVQSELSELILRVNPNTDNGLWELLNESVLVLLRNSDYWSHALASSESITIDKAEQVFNKLSISERSKLSAETLTNVNGKIGQRTITLSEDETAAYIIVTLLIGTADDRPLFKDIHSVTELKQALEQLSTMRPDYLMKLELIWSPQDKSDRLTYDEFISEYTNMVQLV